MIVRPKHHVQHIIEHNSFRREELSDTYLLSVDDGSIQVCWAHSYERYQGHSDQGKCFLPETTLVTVAIKKRGPKVNTVKER